MTRFNSNLFVRRPTAALPPRVAWVPGRGSSRTETVHAQSHRVPLPPLDVMHTCAHAHMCSCRRPATSYQGQVYTCGVNQLCRHCRRCRLSRLVILYRLPTAVSHAPRRTASRPCAWHCALRVTRRPRLNYAVLLGNDHTLPHCLGLVACLGLESGRPRGGSHYRADEGPPSRRRAAEPAPAGGDAMVMHTVSEMHERGSRRCRIGGVRRIASVRRRGVAEADVLGISGRRLASLAWLGAWLLGVRCELQTEDRQRPMDPSVHKGWCTTLGEIGSRTTTRDCLGEATSEIAMRRSYAGVTGGSVTAISDPSPMSDQ